MKDMRSSNWGTRIGRLGYALAMNVTDNMGRSWKYRMAPERCGVVNYCDSLGELALWTRQVEEVRMMVERPEMHKQATQLGIYPVPSRMLPV
jgi:hypothetical protein